MDVSQEAVARVQRMYLRPEARPILFGTLTDAQQDAFRRILEFLVDALPPPITPSSPHSLDVEWLRRDRSSRLVFLSGSRGTGKTTVLLSIVEELLHPRANKQTRYECIDPYIQPMINILSTRLIWMEPLNMETIPLSANMLASILARIEIEARRFGSTQTTEPSQNTYGGALFEPSPGYHETLLKLQQLQTDVALAWDGNLPDRGGQLDPDVFALEVMRAERARLGVNSRLSTVLDDLSRYVSHLHGVADPVFVLPIDDFDISPSMCLPLLRLLRMISVPRLFVLMLGDIDVATVVLNLKVSGDLAKVAHAGALDAHTLAILSIPASEVGKVAGEVAFNALRKLVPPVQRIHLKPLTPREALDFCPLDHEGGTGSRDEQKLSDLFEKWEFDIVILRTPNGKIIKNFKDFVLMSRFSIIEGADDPSIPAYRALIFLASPIRRIVDLWFSLATIDSTKNYIGFFADFCQHALEEERALAGVEPRMVPAALGVWPAEVAILEMLPIELDAPTYGKKLVTTRVDSARVSIRDVENVWAQLVLRCHKGWNLKTTRGQDREECRTFLSPETASALILYHDLLVLVEGQEEVGNSQFSPAPWVTKKQPEKEHWAVIEWRWGDQTKVVEVCWPLPSWKSFWEFDLFLHAWNDIVNKVPPTTARKPQEHLIEWLAFAWLSAATAVISSEEAIRIPQDQWLREPKTKWTKLLGQLAMLLNENTRDTPRGQRIRDWVTRFALMMLPEAGLPLDTRTRIADLAKDIKIEDGKISDGKTESTIVTFWQTVKITLQGLRNYWLASFDVDDKMTSLLTREDLVPLALRDVFFEQLLTSSEVLNFRPGTWALRLHQLFKDFRFKAGYRPTVAGNPIKNLHDLLLVSKLSVIKERLAIKIADKDALIDEADFKDKHSYRALDFLCPSANVVDKMWYYLQGQARRDNIVLVFNRLFYMLLKHESLKLKKDVFDNIIANSLPSKENTVLSIVSSDDKKIPELPSQLIICGHNTWNIRAEIEDDEKYFNPVTVFAIIIYHDMSILLSRDAERKIPSLLKAASSEQPWALVKWGDEPDEVKICWPLPLWESFWEFDLFLGAWNEVVDIAGKVDHRAAGNLVEWLAFAWLSAATAVIGGEAPITIPQDANEWSKEPVEQAKWKKMLDQLVAMLLNENTRDTPRGQRIRDWVTRVALMMLPEVGLQWEVRKKIASFASTPVARDFAVTFARDKEVTTLMEFWIGQKSSLRNIREEWLGRLGESDKYVQGWLSNERLVPDECREIFFDKKEKQE